MMLAAFGPHQLACHVKIFFEIFARQFKDQFILGRLDTFLAMDIARGTDFPELFVAFVSGHWGSNQ